MTVKKTLAVCCAFTLTGCASKAFEQMALEHTKAQAAVVHAHAEQSKTNLVEIELGDDGKLKKLVVGRQLGAAPQMVMPVDPNVQMVGKIVDGVVAVGSIVAGGAAAKGVVEATGAAIGRALVHMPEPVVKVVEQPAPVQIPGAPPPEVVVVPPPEVVVVPPPETVIVKPEIVVVPGGAQ